MSFTRFVDIVLTTCLSINRYDQNCLQVFIRRNESHDFIFFVVAVYWIDLQNFVGEHEVARVIRRGEVRSLRAKLAAFDLFKPQSSQVPAAALKVYRKLQNYALRPMSSILEKLKHFYFVLQIASSIIIKLFLSIVTLFN